MSDTPKSWYPKQINLSGKTDEPFDVRKLVAESDTPRTDAFSWGNRAAQADEAQAMREHARQLERELAEANAWWLQNLQEAAEKENEAMRNPVSVENKPEP